MVRRSWLARGLCAVLLAAGAVVLSIGMSASLGELVRPCPIGGKCRRHPRRRQQARRAGNRQNLSHFQCRRSLRPGESRRIPESLVCHRLVPGCSHPARGRHGRHRRGREPDRLQGRLRRQQRGRGRRADRRSPAQAPHRLHPRARASGRTAHSRRLPPPGPLRGASRSENHQAREQPHRRRLRDQ